MFRFLLVIAALFTAVIPAIALGQTKLTPMSVSIVRDTAPGCEPNCAEWISAQGDIDTTALDSFRRAFKAMGNRKLPILVHSPGGNVEIALQISKMIRQRGLDVAVTKTGFLGCGDAASCAQAWRVSGKPQTGFADPPRSVCASSCVFLLAAGVRRHVGPGTFVGVHRITTFIIRFRVYVTTVGGKQVARREQVREPPTKVTTSDSMYTKVRKFFIDMGVDDSIMALLMKTPSESLHILTRAELVSTRIATDAIDGRELIRSKRDGAQGEPVASAAPSLVPESLPKIAAAPEAASGGRHATLVPRAAGAAGTGLEDSTGPALAPDPSAVPPAFGSATTEPAATPGQGDNPSPKGSGIRERAPAKAPRQRTAALTPQPVAPAAPPARQGSRSGGKCACPEMTSCSGSWVTLSCNALKSLCRSASPVIYTRNGCGRLKQLVGGF